PVVSQLLWHLRMTPLASTTVREAERSGSYQTMGRAGPHSYCCEPPPDFCENSRALVRTRCLPWQRCVSTSSRETKRRQSISRKTNSGVGDTRCHHYSTLPTRSFRRLGVVESQQATAK